ncbi:MAG TPA: substrate-binding domain-containing protein [Ramlibacter sp.]|nr:substrate-binding domain-containing protein [Ramlibacter sp.]
MKRLVPMWVALLCAHVFAAEPLRVCADPDNLPYSRSDGSGFENRIAQLVADDLHLPLAYAWLPDRRGFVRKTLGAQLCDVIIGVPAGFERTATTQPYYRSTYVFVERTSDAPPVRSFDDARLSTMRIGVQLIGNDLAASPPGYVLASHGYTQNVRGYPLAGDEPSSQRAVDAIARGEIDGAFLWGPQAGYFAQRAAVPLRVTALPAPAGAHFDFAIAMGVRRGDAVLRERLDDVLRRRQADIDRILREYGVPRVQGAPQ